MAHSSNQLIHEIFVIDAEILENLEFMERVSITNSIVDDLVVSLAMERLGKLEIYDAIDENYPGWSFIQPITTSHISGHYFEEKEGVSHIHLDIYSCKSFDFTKIINTINRHIKIGIWSGNLITRSIHFKERKMFLIKGEKEEFKMYPSHTQYE